MLKYVSLSLESWNISSKVEIAGSDLLGLFQITSNVCILMSHLHTPITGLLPNGCLSNTVVGGVNVNQHCSKTNT